MLSLIRKFTSSVSPQTTYEQTPQIDVGLYRNLKHCDYLFGM